MDEYRSSGILTTQGAIRTFLSSLDPHRDKIISTDLATAGRTAFVIIIYLHNE